MKIIPASTFIVSLLLAAAFSIPYRSQADTVFPVTSGRLSKSEGNGLTACSPTPTPSPSPSKRDQKGLLVIDVGGPEGDIVDPISLGLWSDDVDCDGILNYADNCLFVYNPKQENSNKGREGDACESKGKFQYLRCDKDGDGITDVHDNCPNNCNPEQRFTDLNGNGVNDSCDSTIPNNVSVPSPCAERRKLKTPKRSQ